MPIQLGVMLSQEAAEKICKRKIVPRAFDWRALGARLLVVVDPKVKEIGGVLLPDESIDRQEMGQGIIIGAGPQAGMMPAVREAGTTIVDSPEDFLGLHVAWGLTGRTMRFTASDGTYNSETIMITPADLLMMDTLPDPVGHDEQLRQAYLLTKQGEEDAAAEKLEQDRKTLVEGSG